MDLRLSGDEVIRLTEEVYAKQKSDTPEFNLETEAQRKAKAPTKSEDVKTTVDVEVPDLPPGLK